MENMPESCVRCERHVTLIDGYLCGMCQSEIVADSPVPTRFLLYRREDESGVSGSQKVVAVGAEFPSGKVEIEWLNDTNPKISTSANGHASYDSIEDAIEIHGHEGRTVPIWVA